MNEDLVKKLIYFLTVNTRASKNKWLNGAGFKRIKKEKLCQYWISRLKKNNPDDIALFERGVVEYNEKLEQGQVGENIFHMGGNYFIAMRSHQQSQPLANQALNFASSLKDFSKSGFLETTQDELDKRLGICKNCDFFDPNAFFGSGRCTKCGCSTWAKLRMATERCPIGKWEAILATP